MSKPTVWDRPTLETLESRLLLTGGIAGTVVNVLTSQPVAGIKVDVYESSNPDSADDQAWDWVTSVQTDGQGRYQVSGLDPRHYRLQLADGDAAANGNHFVEADLFDVVVLDGATTTGMNMQARQAGRITGHVYDGVTGDPVANA
jgi:5-hydroxyisourate hydrolase-like protein (transthyretin family)